MKLHQWLVTLGPLGYLPASGTIGSFVSLLLVVGLKYFAVPSIYQLGIALLLTMVAYYSITYVLAATQHKDPGYIIIDEVVGFLWATLYLPNSIILLLISLGLFRWLDIQKPGLIGVINQSHEPILLQGSLLFFW
jgi:phosphatidylglycerophosphatase A